MENKKKTICFNFDSNDQMKLVASVLAPDLACNHFPGSTSLRLQLDGDRVIDAKSQTTPYVEKHCFSHLSRFEEIVIVNSDTVGHFTHSLPLIDGNRPTVCDNGDIKVGCQTISFATAKKLFQQAERKRDNTKRSKYIGFYTGR